MTTLDQLQIIDAHHHLWDLGRNYYPWLTDKPKRSEILGEYLGIRRTYMPEDYRRDAADSTSSKRFMSRPSTTAMSRSRRPPGCTR